MEQQVVDFITKHRIAVLTTLLTDGTPHGAALHYSHSENPLEIYFSTENTSRKCQALLNGQSGKASVVIGFSEEEWITLQMEGIVEVISAEEKLKSIHGVHYKKHPDSEKYKNDPATVFLKFTLTWWRYTDYNTKPETILSNVS